MAADIAHVLMRDHRVKDVHATWHTCGAHVTFV